MKKRLLIIFALLLLIPTLMICLLTGCNKDGDGEGEATTTERGPRGDAIGAELIRNADLGFFAYGEIASDDDYIADATVRPQNDGISVKFYSDGTANLTVKDYWGNVATVAVTVENSEITNIDVTRFEDPNSVNVKFAGAYGTGNVDDTKAIQGAIDSLPNGGTVYFPAGTYKITKLVLKEGINLRLQGAVEDVSKGYTDEVASRVKNGEFAIIQAGSFVNYENEGYGRDGASNISIVGGMIDYQGAAATKTQIDVNHEGTALDPTCGATGNIAISCGSNYLFENIIIKDIYNAHAFQICGVSNVTIKDCMFAGYMGRAETKGDGTKIVTNRETIQIEYAHSGAMPPAKFDAGEFYYCKNVAIEGCYFGDSDKSGYHVTAIGQHGQNGTANVDGLKIKNCMFDNPYYSAMRFPNYTNVEISGNIFESTEKGYLGGGYFIWLYTEKADKRYDGKTQSGTLASVISAHSVEHDGLHNIDITNNRFIIRGTSNIRVISAVSTDLSQGARTVSNIMKQVKGQLYGANYSGFVKSTNFISHLNFSDNTVAIDADGYSYKSTAVFTAVYDLTVNNNKMVMANGVTFSSSYNKQDGISVTGEKSEKQSDQFAFITSLPSASIIVDDGKGGTIIFKNGGTTARTLTLEQVEHAKITYTIENGNVRVKIVCDEGYSFTGWRNGSASYNPGATVTMSSNITLIATCSK